MKFINLIQDVVNVDFEFYDSNPNMFFSVKNYLMGILIIKGYLDGISYNCS